MRKTIALFAVLFAAACATSYQPADEGWVSGGFTELRLAPDKWHVIVEGNDMSTRKEINQFLLRRCAELALEHDARYFKLEEQEARIRRSITPEGYMITAPRNEATMTLLEGKEKEAFDAVEIIEETNAAAEGRLSARAQQALARLTNAS